MYLAQGFTEGFCISSEGQRVHHVQEPEVCVDPIDLDMYMFYQFVTQINSC